MQQSQTPLTASFMSVPTTHDGETPFWLELSFDAPLAQGSKPQLRELLDVTGGLESRFRRKDGRLDHWQIRVDPSSQNAVAVMLAPSPPCGESGAVCTDDGRTFTTGLATQIHGPASGNNWSGRLGWNRGHTGSRTATGGHRPPRCVAGVPRLAPETERPSSARRLERKMTRRQELNATGTSA